MLQGENLQALERRDEGNHLVAARLPNDEQLIECGQVLQMFEIARFAAPIHENHTFTVAFHFGAQGHQCGDRAFAFCNDARNDSARAVGCSLGLFKDRLQVGVLDAPFADGNEHDQSSAGGFRRCASGDGAQPIDCLCASLAQLLHRGLTGLIIVGVQQLNQLLNGFGAPIDRNRVGRPRCGRAALVVDSQRFDSVWTRRDDQRPCGGEISQAML